MENKLTVSDIPITLRRGTYNIINCGIRTGKTFWATHSLQSHTRDGNLNRILMLVDCIATRDSIINDYSNLCEEADEWWKTRTGWGENPEKIGVMCYQAFIWNVIKDNTNFLSDVDCIVWDECDSIFDFAVNAFVKARKTDFARIEYSNKEILAVVQKYSTAQQYLPLVMLGEWERIINEGRILCIGMSATPERTMAYYKNIVSSANEGKIEAGLRLTEDVYFTNIHKVIEKLEPQFGRAYWCYGSRIRSNQEIVAHAEARGFKAIELHSKNNDDFPLTSEQRRVMDIIIHTGMVPYEYDFVVVNSALLRGFSLQDRRFTLLIVNSLNTVAQEQAGRMTFPYSRALKTYAEAIDEKYLNKWLTVEECRDLAEEMAVPVPSKSKKHLTYVDEKIEPMTWNKLKDFLPSIGYEVEKNRKVLEINGKQQIVYRITGEWQPFIPTDKDFLAMLKEKGE